ncbi:MAG: RNB domain-containing ribonuclease, partial [Pseudomonadota bacterium]|nr:RNB domain-containing ribonuclease [Pseudomonadota bacterium]
MANLPQDSLVLYKSGPARIKAVDDKLEIELEQGRTLRVRPKDVTLLHPGPMASLNELSLPRGEVEAAWEILAGSTTSLAELAELAYGAYTPATAWAAWRLVAEGLYFQGTPQAVLARSQEDVHREQAARAARIAEEAAWGAFLERVQAGHTAAGDAAFLREVEELALGRREKSRVLHALGRPQSPESAHALLLKLGWWDVTVNPHPPRVGATMQPPAAELPELPQEGRVDLTHLPAYAIDDEGNADPDDALSLEGGRIWVHVADAAALVAPDSPADLEARARGATLYLPEATVTMLPPQATQRLGLGLNAVSPALSFGLDVGGGGEVRSLELVPSWVRVQRLTYAEVEQRLDQAPFADLHRLALAYRERRRQRGAVLIDLPEVRIRVTGGRVDIRPLPRLGSRVMVSEAMLMAGEAAARFALDRGIPFPFTTQDPPDVYNPGEGLAGAYAMRRSLKRRQHKSVPGPHSGLGLSAYAQVTSPLRRYLDLVAHQQLGAYLRGRGLLETQAMVERVGAAEAVTATVRQAERLSRMHWTLVWLQGHPEWRGSGILVDKRPPRGTVLI